MTAEEGVAVVIVTHESAAQLAPLLDALEGQMREHDELAIVDNASSDGTGELACAHEAVSSVIETGSNLGFAGGCHRGAAATSAPLLVFLNPDLRPEPDCLQRLRAAAVEHAEWGAWQATVLLDQRRINSSGGVVHYLGIGWAGDCERSVDALPARDREIAFASGAVLAVRRDVWEQLGGMDPEYFMYGEDLDFGLRLWLAGHRVGLLTQARASHGYDFHKGAYKWFWLERNRWRTVLSVYPAGLLLAVAPMLLVAELGLLLVAVRDGWILAKLRAQWATIVGLPDTLRRRRRIQRTRRVSTAEFASRLTGSLENPYIALPGPLQTLQSWYWRAVVAALALLGPRGDAPRTYQR